MRVHSDASESLAELVRIVWPDHTLEELAEIISGYVRSDNSAVFAKIVDGKYVGAALCCMRHDYVEGCKTSPVGYLEGVSVHEAYRRQGIARTLVSECEDWARENGCSEFASDCELSNTDSIRFHGGIGFQEQNRIVCFKNML